MGSLLLRHLVGLGRAAGLQELTAVVLADNAAMLRVLGNLGFTSAGRQDPDTVRLALKLA
ncbi:MAG: hypothetical protein P0Y66_05810 [Candidatus Kaistia colombiensis]|nr:MAG: hypothetical protein P0Y66_05810 [Kaistia sp.]